PVPPAAWWAWFPRFANSSAREMRASSPMPTGSPSRLSVSSNASRPSSLVTLNLIRHHGLPSLEMKQVLIIEDDQLVANIYSNKFSVDHFQVETALDGSAGLDLIGSFHPDVVLLDLMLPKISGLDLLRKIRSQPGLEKLPIIVFSNTYLSNMVQEAWKAGATKCLSKANCTPKQVLEVVQSLLPATSALAAATAKPSGSGSAAASNAATDAEFQAELLRSFVESLPATLVNLRSHLQTLIKTADEPTRVKLLQDLYRKIRALTGNAGIAGMLQIAQMADTLEALLKDLAEKPKNINASSLRTVALAVDFLGNLFDRANLPEARTQIQLTGRVLVVDD